MPALGPRSSLGRVLALLSLALLPGCFLRRAAIGGLADAIADSDVFASDDDPELVRDALPFALKAIEALRQASPEDPDLALAACRGFTQYASAFVEADADVVEADDWEEAERLRERALNLYLRARDYGIASLELDFPGIGDALRRRPTEAAARLGRGALERAYWTGAAWGSAVSLGLDRPEVVADVDAARALLRRVLELDEDFGQGAIHEAFIAIEALPELMGGSRERAREHFERAVELTDGKSASPYVSYATKVAVREQDRAEFERLLASALAIDPDAVRERRLSNRIDQRRARHLLEDADTLFLDSGE